MAKRRLKRPDLPPGRRLEFFVHLQELVVQCGDEATIDIAKQVGLSHQTVWQALTGPILPSRRSILKLAAYFDAREENGSTTHEVSVLKRYTDALLEERADLREPGHLRSQQVLRRASTDTALTPGQHEAQEAFLAGLRQVVKGSGQSYRVISGWARNYGLENLQPSTISDILHHRLPSYSQLWALLQACQVPETAIREWHSRLVALTSGGRSI